MNFLIAAGAVYCAAALIGFGFARADECLHYEPATVVVSGTVKWYWAYRRADFNLDKPLGERKHRYAVLILDQIACVTGGDPAGADADEFNVVAMQMSSISTKQSARIPETGHVQVRGKLTHRVSGGVTPVILDFAAIEPVPR